MARFGAADRKLARRAVVVALALGGGVLALPRGAGATDPLDPITSVSVSAEAEDITISWVEQADAGSSPEEDDPATVTIAELRMGMWSGDYSANETPGFAMWFPIQEQVLDQANQTITIPNSMGVWPAKMMVRLRQFTPGIEDVGYSPTTMFTMPASVPPATTFSIANQERLASKAELETTGIGFPAAGWGVTAGGEGEYRFYTSSNPSGDSPLVTDHLKSSTGTTEDPIAAVDEDPVVVHGPDRAVSGNPIYGDAYSTSIYYDVASERYFMTYIANRLAPEQKTDFQVIGLAYSEDGQEFWDLDIVISSPTEDGEGLPDGAHNYVGSPSMVVRDGVAYLYFLQDIAHTVSDGVVGDGSGDIRASINESVGIETVYTHRPAVARASLEDLNDAVDAEISGDYVNPGDLFMKFGGGEGDGFGEEGLEGNTAPITTTKLEGQQSIDAIYSACTNQIYLVTTSYDFTTMFGMGLRSSGSALLIGASDNPSSFAMESLVTDYDGKTVPHASLLTAATLVSGDADPKVAEDPSFDLIVGSRGVPAEFGGMDSQTKAYSIDRLSLTGPSCTSVPE